MCSATKLTAKKKKDFLDLLAQTGNVSQSAEAVGTTRYTVYRARKADPEFAAAWDEAVEVAVIALEDEARRRAYEGVEEPVFYKGEVCGSIQRYSDTLLIFLLKGHKPDKYRDKSHVELTGRDGGPIETRDATLEELKKLDPRELAKRYSEALTQSKEA